PSLRGTRTARRFRGPTTLRPRTRSPRSGSPPSPSIRRARSPETRASPPSGCRSRTRAGPRAETTRRNGSPRPSPSSDLLASPAALPTFPAALPTFLGSGSGQLGELPHRDPRIAAVTEAIRLHAEELAQGHEEPIVGDALLLVVAAAQ